MTSVVKKAVPAVAKAALPNLGAAAATAAGKAAAPAAAAPAAAAAAPASLGSEPIGGRYRVWNFNLPPQKGVAVRTRTRGEARENRAVAASSLLTIAFAPVSFSARVPPQFAFATLFGIGRTQGFRLCGDLGLNPYQKLREIPDADFEAIKTKIESTFEPKHAILKRVGQDTPQHAARDIAGRMDGRHDHGATTRMTAECVRAGGTPPRSCAVPALSAAPSSRIALSIAAPPIRFICARWTAVVWSQQALSSVGNRGC